MNNNLTYMCTHCQHYNETSELEGTLRCTSCKQEFDISEAEQMLHVVYIMDRDGEEKGQEEFETKADLYKSFPDATEITPYEYEAFDELYGYDPDYEVDLQQDSYDDDDFDYDVGYDDGE